MELIIINNKHDRRIKKVTKHSTECKSKEKYRSPANSDGYYGN